MFLDVNGLKKVNDSLGHDYGDQLLIIVSKIILDNVRSDNILLRYGGDEFILVIKETSIEKAKIIWQRINAAFKDVNENEDLLFNISVSHGIVEYSSNENTSLNDLIKKADKKMYEEKKRLNKSLSLLK